MSSFSSNIEKIREEKEFQSATDVKGYTSLPLQAGWDTLTTKKDWGVILTVTYHRDPVLFSQVGRIIELLSECPGKEMREYQAKFMSLASDCFKNSL